MSANTPKQHYKISQVDRNQLSKHKSFLVWFTGLSGSGKSTLADALEVALYEKGIRTFVLDGDNVRRGISRFLGFSPGERSENIRIVGEVAKLFVEAGVVTFAAFISPFQKDRQKVKSLLGAENFVEIYLNTSVNVCEKRDVKGLYKKVREGEISEFTGITSPYEPPENPDLQINTCDVSIDEAVARILIYLQKKLY